MTFKRIELNYPDFGLTLERDFTPGINLIEETNGYGKTTILNTILSLYSKKYVGIKGGTLPTGTAKLYTEDKVYMLSKKIWVGLEQEPNDLIRYILPGEFFALGTPEQRKMIVRLLGIDYDSYMKDFVPEWNKDLEKEIKGRLKENEGKESVILDDITRLKSIVIKFEKNPIVIVDNTTEILQAYSLKEQHNNNVRMNIILDNNKNLILGNRIRSDIELIKKDQANLRRKFMDLTSGTCPTCNQSMKITQDQIDEINASGVAMGEEIKDLQKQLNDIPMSHEVPPAKDDGFLDDKAKEVGIEIKISTIEEKQSVAEYEAAKKELALKTAMLKKLGELDDRTTLETIKSTKVEFTKELEVKVKELGLDIELFKEQANGETVESFIIMKDGKQYSELSGGNKLIVQLRLAMAFARILELDFLLLDEAGLISQNNFEIIKEECKDYQVIMARATPFQIEAPYKKLTKKVKAMIES